MKLNATRNTRSGTSLASKPKRRLITKKLILWNKKDTGRNGMKISITVNNFIRNLKEENQSVRTSYATNPLPKENKSSNSKMYNKYMRNSVKTPRARGRLKENNRNSLVAPTKAESNLKLNSRTISVNSVYIKPISFGSKAMPTNQLENIKNRENHINLVPAEPNKLGKPRCQCSLDKHLPCCSSAAKWLQYAYDHKGAKFDYDKQKKVYEDLSKLPSNKEIAEESRQIIKDLDRTYPSCPYFCEPGEGQTLLKRILVTYAKYDPSIGYVQGMNFVVGALLYHSNEPIAFWLFVAIMEDYELRSAFEKEMTGMYKHIQILELLCLEMLHDVYSHFCHNYYNIDMFATEWIITLFCSVVPIEYNHLILDQFFAHSWPFFYRFSIHLIRVLKKDILSSSELSELMNSIKSTHPSHAKMLRGKESWGRKILESFPLLGKLIYKNKLHWPKLIEGSREESINNLLLEQLLNHYDYDKMQFKLFPKH